MSDKAYRSIVYEDPRIQAQFAQVVQHIRDAEAARAPLAARHRQAEDEYERGAMSASEFAALDKQYIAANNAIAAAQHAVDDFLNTHGTYTSL